MKLKLSAKMSQRLVMTPAMQQAIKLLPLTRLELVEAIRQELDENPFLEEQLPEETAEKAGELEPKPAEEGFEEETLIRKEDVSKQNEEVDWSSFMEEDAYEGGTGEGYKERPSLENTLSRAESLHDHLMWQLNVTISDPRENEIGQVMISDIDDQGFFKTDLAQIAEETDTTVDEVEKILDIIKKFDPTGVGARDIKECLLLQAHAIEPNDPIIREIIEKYLDQLSERNYAKIARDLGVDAERVIEAVEFIRSLDPSPGSAFGTERPQYVEPDLYVVKVDDEWQVHLNDDGMPRLKINNLYRKILKTKEKPENGGPEKPEGGESKEKEFVENKFQTALWLIKSIEQRRQTLLKVGRSLVKFQKGFIDHGMSHLQPLVLKTVAEDIGMHESTVSRVTRNKYIDTPQGIFELKYFFHSGVGSYLGSTVSSVRVKEMIKKIVLEEDGGRPATDDMLVELLQTRDVKIARRTITKYRKELGIPPASKRKKLY